MSKTKKFCEYKYGVLLAMAAFSMIIEYVMGLLDRIIVANMLGEMAFSATNMIMPLFSLTMFVSTIIAAETAEWHAVYMGRFEKKRADQIFGQGILMASVAGVVMFVIALIGGSIYLNYLGMSPTMHSYAAEYYKFYQFTVLFTPMYTLLLKVIYEEGDSAVYCGSFLMRIIADVVLSIVFCNFMGIAGVGLGTVLADILGLAVLLLHFKRPNNALNYEQYFNKQVIIDMLRSGSPTASIYFYQAIFTAIMNKFFISYLGEQYLPVMTVVVTVTGITAIFASAGQAAEPLCFVYQGEKNEKKERQVMEQAGKTAVSFGVAGMVFYGFGSMAVQQIFALSDPLTIRYATIAVRIVAPSLVFLSLVSLVSSYYTIQGADATCLFINGISELVAPLFFSIPLGYLFGVLGVWIGFALAPILSLAIVVFVVQKQRNMRELKLLPQIDEDASIYSFDIEITEQNIVQLQEQVEALLELYDVNARSTLNALLMIEEVLLLVRDKNLGKRVYAECTIRIDEDVQLILRDSGVIFDVTDADMSVSSMRIFVVSSMMERHQEKVHLVTTSYNRNAFRFAI